MDSHALVRAYFDAVTAGELPDRLLTDDMTAWTTTQGEMDKPSYQEAIHMLAQMCATPIAFTIVSITAEADRAVAEARSTARLIDGSDYANAYIFAFRFRNGRIAHVAEHFNAIIVREKLVPLLGQLAAQP